MFHWRRIRPVVSGLLAGVLCCAPHVAPAATTDSLTRPCRIPGVPTELRCGSLARALDPARPQGPKIDIHFLVAPARARNKQPDPVLLLAGGPGQSAIQLASAVLGALGPMNNRRDLVFVDQRGTGRSAPLECPDESRMPLARALDAAEQLRRILQCRDTLQKLPYGDLRFFTTTVAMQDIDAVREHLGAPQWNLVGGSYGTRAALEYMRLYPERVRRAVLDGVAPPDMVLPTSFSVDTQAALDAMFLACEAEAACARRFPGLRSRWVDLLASLPREAVVAHPLTGEPERLVLTREVLLRAVRAPLYAPASASALPAAVHDATRGRFEGLVGLSGLLGGDKRTRLAAGMHFSVICAEDAPRIAADAPAGADYGRMDAQWYSQVCEAWPKGSVDPAFYTVPPARQPVLVFSGGADPATPPRHGERVSKALGPRAMHVVVPQAGHGMMGTGCLRDAMARFIQAADDAQARKLDAGCAAGMPRAMAYLPPQPGEGAP